MPNWYDTTKSLGHWAKQTLANENAGEWNDTFCAYKLFSHG